ICLAVVRKRMDKAIIIVMVLYLWRIISVYENQLPLLALSNDCRRNVFHGDLDDTGFQKVHWNGRRIGGGQVKQGDICLDGKVRVRGSCLWEGKRLERTDHAGPGIESWLRAITAGNVRE